MFNVWRNLTFLGPRSSASLSFLDNREVNPPVKRSKKCLKVKETVTALSQGEFLTKHATDCFSVFCFHFDLIYFSNYNQVFYTK